MCDCERALELLSLELDGQLTPEEKEYLLTLLKTPAESGLDTGKALFLFMSPVCLFLTGFAWPASNFPGFWRLFSYIFPSTFAVRAFIDMNTAGADIAMAGQHMTALGIQIIVYYLLSCLSAYDENLSGRAFWRALCHKKPRLNSRHYETTDFDAGSDISRVHRVSPEERNPTGTYRQVEERYGRLPGQEGTGA